MQKAHKGDTVHVHYQGKLEDGTVFGSSRSGGPIEFTLGRGHVIPGVEQAVEGLEVGEKISTTVTPDSGYGARRPELILNVDRNKFPNNSEPALGDHFELSSEEGGKPVTVTVRKVEDETIEVDANHPLAGHQLHFDLQLVSIA